MQVDGNRLSISLLIRNSLQFNTISLGTLYRSIQFYQFIDIKNHAHFYVTL